DPTFTDDVWVTQAALDQESSGYYLVPSGELPPGWASVAESEAENVWGKGSAGTNTPPLPYCVAPRVKDCPECTKHGMADYNVDAARISLSISDTPIAYTPPKGSAVEFTISYQQREVAPVSIPNYSNLGNKWSLT